MLQIYSILQRLNLATPYVGPIEKAQAFGSLVGWFLDDLFSHTFWGDAICEGEFGKQTNKQTNIYTYMYIYIYAICVYYCTLKNI